MSKFFTKLKKNVHVTVYIFNQDIIFTAHLRRRHEFLLFSILEA